MSITALIIALFCMCTVVDDVPTQLVELRKQYQAIHNPNDSDRIRYITALVRLRESYTRKDYKKMEDIDGEITKLPMPPDVDSDTLRKSIIGKWTSPRHKYLYRADGTWTMLPEFEEGDQATHGVWHIEGNRFFENALINPSLPRNKGETVIMVTDTDFVWSTNIAPYYMRRGDVYPWRD